MSRIVQTFVARIRRTAIDYKVVVERLRAGVEWVYVEALNRFTWRR